jgi:Na+/melibiose symporter-like transporter
MTEMPGAAAAATASLPRLKLWERALYGLGAGVSGIKQRAVTAFMLLFYNQVVGLPAGTVALVMTITVIVDAFVDPIIGQFSDHLRTRLGRRHPLMYAAALPIGVLFFLLFNPPAGWGDTALAVYLLVCLALLGAFESCFELPASALLPELASGYVERARIAAWRMVAIGLGPLLVTILSYEVFLKESPGGGGGVLDRGGYFGFALFFGALLTGIALASAAATHRYIPLLRKPRAKAPTAVATFKEIIGTLNNRSYLAILVGGLFAYIGLGLRNGLDVYFGLYFWQLSQGQLASLGIAATAGAVVGATLAPKVVRRVEKKWALIVAAGLANGISALPIFLRLVGVMPPNGSTALFVILLADAFFHITLAMIALVSVTSMLADVVEDVEVRTGRRSEGLLLSADSFFKKVVSSVGVLLVGVVLTWAKFPTGAERNQVPPDVLTTMGWIYLPLLVVLIGCYLTATGFYRITRERHEGNLETLRVRNAEILS